MYEQYTDKQIVEMLVPKLEKLCPYYDWNNYLNSEGYEAWLHFVATLYKSGYIRGQLGRSFIIGQPKRTKPKQTKHWVPITEDNVKVGSKVRYLNAKKHLESPEFYPSQGTIGKVVSVCNDNTCLVQWPSYKDAWYARWPDLEVLLCE